MGDREYGCSVSDPRQRQVSNLWLISPVWTRYDSFGTEAALLYRVTYGGSTWLVTRLRTPREPNHRNGTVAASGPKNLNDCCQSDTAVHARLQQLLVWLATPNHKRSLSFRRRLTA